MGRLQGICGSPQITERRKAMEEALLKRVMPHSIEAEQSVVGAMILDRDAVTVATEMLSAEDFYQKQYSILFEAMAELYSEGKPIDLITLQNRLKEKDVPPEISSLEFVRDMITTVPTSANVKYYAEIVSEKALLRRLIKVNEDIAAACYAGKERVEDILEDTEKVFFRYCSVARTMSSYRSRKWFLMRLIK